MGFQGGCRDVDPPLMSNLNSPCGRQQATLQHITKGPTCIMHSRRVADLKAVRLSSLYLGLTNSEMRPRRALSCCTYGSSRSTSWLMLPAETQRKHDYKQELACCHTSTR